MFVVVAVLVYFLVLVPPISKAPSPAKPNLVPSSFRATTCAEDMTSVEGHDDNGKVQTQIRELLQIGRALQSVGPLAQSSEPWSELSKHWGYG